MNSKRSLVLCLFLLTAASCGPMYETQYTFVPPSSPEGRTCTFQCENGRNQCQMISSMQKDRCEEQARRDQQYCQWDLERRGKKEHWYDCGLASCSDDTERCESQYRSCYQACGGQVLAEQVCVMNCAQAVPPPPSGR